MLRRNVGRERWRSAARDEYVFAALVRERLYVEATEESLELGVSKIALPAGKALFIARNPELVRDRVNVVHVPMDERVAAGVALVLASPCSRRRARCGALSMA